MTGTLFGRRKGRVALALPEKPRSLPSLVVELALQTHALLRELGSPTGARRRRSSGRRAPGLVRVRRPGRRGAWRRCWTRVRGLCSAKGRRPGTLCGGKRRATPDGDGDAAAGVRGRRRSPNGSGLAGRRGGVHARLLRALLRLPGLGVTLHGGAPGRRHRPGAGRLVRQALNETQAGPCMQCAQDATHGALLEQ